MKLIRAGKTAEARASLNELQPRLTKAGADNLELMVSDTELVAALEVAKDTGDGSAFEAMLAGVRARGVVAPNRLKELEVNWRLFVLSGIAKTGGWLAALEAADDAVVELGNDSQLQRVRRIYRENHKAELHNAAADAYNRRSYDEALSLTEDALQFYPGESMFIRLRGTIEAARR